jgi:hypothetical protein
MMSHKKNLKRLEAMRRQSDRRSARFKRAMKRLKWWRGPRLYAAIDRTERAIARWLGRHGLPWMSEVGVEMRKAKKVESARLKNDAVRLVAMVAILGVFSFTVRWLGVLLGYAVRSIF